MELLLDTIISTGKIDEGVNRVRKLGCLRKKTFLFETKPFVIDNILQFVTIFRFGRGLFFFCEDWLEAVDVFPGLEVPVVVEKGVDRELSAF